MCFLNLVPVPQARAGGEFVNSDVMELARQGREAQGPEGKPGVCLSAWKSPLFTGQPGPSLGRFHCPDYALGRRPLSLGFGGRAGFGV